MAGQYDVSTDTMAQSQSRMASNVADIRSELTQLRGKLGALEGQWMGDGNTAFTGAHARYEAANQKLNQALDTISSLVARARDGYRTSDSAAGQRLTQSGAGMDDVTVPGF
ncbi:WXG100 family type VII secretion target [Actinomycetospora sp.]|jgi:WXG100 family type VII secretion target|uniref:WXG100 family type VII secretion target n=1 Tax=Actinomycetospora sp. TaxID=1872135 RepID=UPI002F3E8D78